MKYKNGRPRKSNPSNSKSSNKRHTHLLQVESKFSNHKEKKKKKKKEINTEIVVGNRKNT